MKKQGRYSNEFKQEVLRMAETTDKPESELEQINPDQAAGKPSVIEMHGTAPEQYPYWD
ncbi:MAG: hypothetical protein JW966_11660 [Anaerolineae bacterium]|nr:hypothetical protein [Anaerolineae bacterium]